MFSAYPIALIIHYLKMIGPESGSAHILCPGLVSDDVSYNCTETTSTWLHNNPPLPPPLLTFTSSLFQHLLEKPDSGRKQASLDDRKWDGTIVCGVDLLASKGVNGRRYYANERNKSTILT